MIQGTQTSVVRSFNQVDFDRFALLSGDSNPIHTDPGFSAQTRFGRTIAHGMLLCGVLRGLINKVVPGGRLTEQSVVFPSPTYADEAMRFVVTVTSRSQGRADVQLDFEMEVMRISDGAMTSRHMVQVLPQSMPSSSPF